MTTLPGRAHYSDAEREFFRGYHEHRAAHRPEACRGDGAHCWVSEGPPAVGKNGQCLGCNQHPKAEKPGRPPRYAR